MTGGVAILAALSETELSIYQLNRLQRPLPVISLLGKGKSFLVVPVDSLTDADYE